MSEKIKLQYPVEIDGRKYTELTMRRCKVKDRRAAVKASSDPVDQEISLISNLCEVPPDVIDNLDASDYDAAQKVLLRFFGSAPMKS